MSKRRFGLGGLVVVAAALASALPANAESQPGCQTYGQFIAATAQAPGNAGHDLVAATATSGPGEVAALSEVLRQATCP
jgi:hypothetical protein